MASSRRWATSAFSMVWLRHGPAAPRDRAAVSRHLIKFRAGFNRPDGADQPMRRQIFASRGISVYTPLTLARACCDPANEARLRWRKVCCRPPHPPPHTPRRMTGSSWLRLIRSRRVGPVTFHRLMAEHGIGRGGAGRRCPAIARAAGVEDYAALPDRGGARMKWRRRALAGARLLLWGGPDYPAALMDLPDAPPVLWVQGDVALADPADGGAGGRAQRLRRLGCGWRGGWPRGWARPGYVVVSGLARGIDAEAHDGGAGHRHGRGAGRRGGRDLPDGKRGPGRARSRPKGCRISEQPMGLEPQARHFPLRNRIIVGPVPARWWWSRRRRGRAA